MTTEYLPKINEKIEYYDKKFNYKKKQEGIVRKVTKKFVFIEVPEKEVINFERTDVFESNQSIQTLKQGDTIRFKKTIRQKEYLTGIIKAIDDNKLEIEYITEKKIEPVLLEQNFSLDKIKKAQELHGDKIQGSVYERRIDNLLAKTNNEDAKKTKKITFVTKDEVFPKIDIIKEIDNESINPSNILYIDLIQNNFPANTCKTKFKENIEKQDQCNQFYDQFGNILYTELFHAKDVNQIEDIIHDIRGCFYKPSITTTAKKYLYNLSRYELEQPYEKNYFEHNPQENKNLITYNDSEEKKNFLKIEMNLSRDDFDYKKYNIPESLLSKINEKYSNEVDQYNEIMKKYNIYGNEEFMTRLSDNFSSFLLKPSRKDKKVIEDIKTIAYLEDHFDNELLRQSKFNNFTFNEKNNIKYETLLSFVKAYVISNQLPEYVEKKDEGKTNLNDVLKLLKSKDENLDENRFNLSALSINELDQKIQNEFGLRSIQYGITVQEGSEEYKHDLLELLYGSLHDLANATNLDSQYIGLGNVTSLNVEDKKQNLGLAIGARGKGGAAAHFEPDENVINLTRSRGNGSLAHEWGHAFDKYLRSALNDQKRVEKAQETYREFQKRISIDDILQNKSKYDTFLNKYQSNSVYTLGNYTLEKTLSQAKGDILLKGFEDHPISQDVENLIYEIRDSDFCRAGRRVDFKYLGSDEECFARGFQSYIADKTNNRYLALNTNQNTIKSDEELTKKMGRDNILLNIFPQGKERIKINTLFENVFQHKNELQMILKKNNGEIE